MNKIVADLKPAAEMGDPLALLRKPFPSHQISKLPKPTKKQTEDLRANFKLGARCALCGGWHQPEVVHLDYVGHAALTDRLLDVDPHWSWQPVATDPNGLPLFDKNGGLWIKLTVCDVTRLGYGNADGKSGGDAVKEIIGDALRNAAMRFGAALDLWHKGDLHAEETPDSAEGDGGDKQPADAAKDETHREPTRPTLSDRADRLEKTLREVMTEAQRAKAWKLSEDLRKELDERDPERLVTLEQLNSARAEALAPQHKEAAE